MSVVQSFQITSVRSFQAANSICQELIFGAAFECNRIFFEIVAVSQILETLEIIDITALVQPTGFYCFAYKVKILMILTYPNSSLIGK